jgi:hypothetical protein
MGHAELGVILEAIDVFWAIAQRRREHNQA